MHGALTFVAVLALEAPAPAGVAPRGIVNARVETRSGASGLAALVKDAAARPGPLWIGWSVPSSREHAACCWTSLAEGADGCPGCRLEGGEGLVVGSENVARLEGSSRLRVLLRAEGSRVGKIRVFSEDCPIDAGGLPLVWLEDVRPAESVALLAGFVEQTGEGAGKRLDGGAIAAIAFHEDASADAALDRFVAKDEPLSVRKPAVFWLGQARGARGYERLKQLVREDGDRRLREHAVFSLSQSREPGAVDTIIEVARRDEDAHVRGQALFWLAQTASRRAAPAIRSALDDDPEAEVKKKAVFALSQLPKDEGVPLLIGVARSHRSAEVRKQAMFWLGESGDARALAFFEEVLGR